MLQLQKVSKSYGTQTVFRNISHRFAHGLFALQGPNGVGKSTLLAVLSGAESMDAGDVRVQGCSLRRDPIAAKQRLAYVPDECPVYPFLSGRRFLQFVAKVKGTEDFTMINELVAQFALEPHLDTRFDAMSLGTQKKFLLSAAWIGNPVVMLVDEPDNGLDAPSTDRLVAHYRAMADDRLVLFSTHNREFVAKTGAEIVDFSALTSGG